MNDKYLYIGYKKIADITNREFKIETIDDRIRFQKIVYLLKFFNYKPAKEFDFNMYLHGPYSPDLAKLYYENNEIDFSKAPKAKDIPKKVIEFIKEADDNGVEFLEALVTTLDFKKKDPDYKECIKRASKIKPYITENTWNRVLEFLNKNNTLITNSI